MIFIFMNYYYHIFFHGKQKYCQYLAIQKLKGVGLESHEEGAINIKKGKTPLPILPGTHI